MHHSTTRTHTLIGRARRPAVAGVAGGRMNPRWRSSEKSPAGRPTPSRATPHVYVGMHFAADGTADDLPPTVPTARVDGWI
jgi:hypothetical protein